MSQASYCPNCLYHRAYELGIVASGFVGPMPGVFVCLYIYSGAPHIYIYIYIYIIYIIYIYIYAYIERYRYIWGYPGEFVSLYIYIFGAPYVYIRPPHTLVA